MPSHHAEATPHTEGPVTDGTSGEETWGIRVGRQPNSAAESYMAVTSVTGVSGLALQPGAVPTVGKRTSNR